jgi:NADH dehydrogenase [ubiquinone] 1 alpha subcomplex assembly factor 7
MQLSPARGVKKHVHLVETSETLRDVQSKTLEAWSKVPGITLHWHDSLDSIPLVDNAYTMLIAHEFFDALPFHLLEVCLSDAAL